MKVQSELEVFWIVKFKSETENVSAMSVQNGRMVKMMVDGIIVYTIVVLWMRYRLCSVMEGIIA